MVKLFKLEILTPDRGFFEGEVESLVVNTPTGEMGILCNTLPMVASLTAGIMRIKQRGKWMEAAGGEGFIEIKPDGVMILVHSANWPHEINEDALKREIDQMSVILKKQQSLHEYKLAKAQLARQFAKLKLKDRGMD
ncbi:MAG: ATP synthase F1 subunit epsilon [Firmicutes bacterium]|nr:ATP synthase F1 subunit epsilon [Bacillota bacterium]